jgi:hypothetical protein
MLTDTAARSARAKEKPYKLADTGGLYLLVTSNSKLWRWDYAFQGKRNTLGLGSYPETPLAKARAERDQLKALLKQGTDPSYHRKLHRHTQTLNTFQAIADEFVAKITREGQAEQTLQKTRWLLSLAPTLARRPIHEIKAPELLMVLKPLEAREHYESAKRLRSLMGRIFRYAIATGRAERDPAADLKGAANTRVLEVQLDIRQLLMKEPPAPKPKERWGPKAGEEFWCIEANGDVYSYDYDSVNIYQQKLIAIGNCYPSKKAVLAALPRVIAAYQGEGVTN